ncbi:MAG: hypothetical protein ACFFDK_18295 [Promethearchaeota archaeon]
MVTENIDFDYCKYCGWSFPEEFVKEVKENNEQFYCEMCGAENKIEKNDILRSKKEKIKKKIKSPLIVKELRLLFFRHIYEILKSPNCTLEFKKDQKQLTLHQTDRLTKILRDRIVNQEFQKDWLNNLPNIRRIDFEDRYENLQSYLSSKRKYRERFLKFFRKSIEFVFELINGCQKISNLSGFKREIAEDLKKRFGFAVNNKFHKDFEFYLTIFISRYIYETIKLPEFVPIMGGVHEDLTLSQINKLAYGLKKSIAYQQIRPDWLEEFKKGSKKEFMKRYDKLQHDIKSDQIYSESFMDHLRFLIKFVFRLIHGKYNASDLHGFENAIAEDLKDRIFLQFDTSLPGNFKFNLLIILSRLIFFIIQSYGQKAHLKLKNNEIDESFTNKIISTLKSEILARRIKSVWKKKLYKINHKDFEKQYEKFQFNLKTDQIYHESFLKCVKGIIITVFKLLSGKNKKSDLSKFERAVIMDLNKLNITQNHSNFQEKVIEHIKKLINLIKCKIEQKKIILSESEKILKEHISRARKGEITIRSNANPLTNAAAIIYAVLISNENMPKISAERLSKMVGTSNPMVGILYNKWYKNLAQRLDFNFKGAQLGRSREIISLYLFEFLISTKIDLDGLILHLEKIDISKIILRLREIFIDAEKQLIQKEAQLLEQLTERDIKVYKDMGTNYSDVFDKYFTDLINIIKLLIISNKSHKIIGADFSAAHFTRFLMDNNINLFSVEETLLNIVRMIFNFLKDTKYFNLFPALTKTDKPGTSRETRIDLRRRDIVGSRIKLYIMNHIYNGIYLDKEDGIAKCPDCLREGFTVNTSIPSKRSMEFHHKNAELEEEYRRYDSNELYNMFTKDRGNPYFLPDLISEMQRESVVLKCGSHHIVIHNAYFDYFKKLICWEDIPSKFPYQDIFDLPADIIHTFVIICIDNFYKTKMMDNNERDAIRLRLISGLKKKYIIDHIYDGICPACGEFNTKDHLRAFEYNHLYELRKLTPEERRKRKKMKISQLYKSLSCSEIVREMEKKYHKGGYVCRNCHFIIHDDISNVDEIFGDENLINSIINIKKKTIRKFRQNLIYSREDIKDILKPEREQYESIIKYLFALFEISKRKQGGVTRKDLANYLGYKESRGVFERRKFSKQYIRIVAGGKNRETLYYLKPEGEEIVRLMYYFRDYYKNYKKNSINN